MLWSRAELSRHHSILAIGAGNALEATDMHLTAFVFVTALFSWLVPRCDQEPVAEPEIHLIPAGFIGQVTIHHNRADGAEPVYEHGARVYRIPPGGVLHSRLAPNYGVRAPAKMKFFYVSPAGQRQPVAGREETVSQDVACILGTYQVGPDLHYFVDQPRNAGKYRNPAVEQGERQ
jgi:hypothetical protein